MFFKKINWKPAVSTAVVLLGLLTALGRGPVPLRGETVDGIVAVVHSEIITLADLHVVAAFGLHPGGGKERESLPLRVVLDRFIDQKLVLRLTAESVTMTRRAVDDALSAMIRDLGRDEFRRRLELFDLSEMDLREYLEEYLIYQETISRRFNRAAFINLREIENHYRLSYIPEQEALGAAPKRMTEVLEEIESELREVKRQAQIVEWLGKLRLEAEIQLFMDRYPEFFSPGTGERRDPPAGKNFAF